MCVLSAHLCVTHHSVCWIFLCTITYVTGRMLQDAAAFILSSVICLGYISALGWASRHEILDKNLSRKLMHIGEDDQPWDAPNLPCSI